MTDTKPTREPPSLMDLVYRYGGYPNIPPEAWEQYHQAVKDYQHAIATGALWSRPGPPEPKYGSQPPPDEEPEDAPPPDAED